MFAAMEDKSRTLLVHRFVAERIGMLSRWSRKLWSYVASNWTGNASRVLLTLLCFGWRGCYTSHAKLCCCGSIDKIHAACLVSFPT